MKSRILTYSTLVFAVCVSTFLLWLPFLLKTDFWLGLDFRGTSLLTVYQNFDGLLYIVPAKTLYDIDSIQKLHLELSLPPNYFAAHLPLFPLLIRFFAPVFGFLKSMLFVTLISSVGLTLFFYYFVSKFKLTSRPLILSLVFLFLPRFLIVRSVGAPETLFILMVLISLFFFEKKQYFLAGFFGALAAFTKIPGILLGVAYVLVFIEEMVKGKKFEFRWLGVTTLALGLLGVFTLYYFQINDFWAYFHTEGVVKMPYPFAAFNFPKMWVGTAWVEDILLYFFLYGLAVVYLFRSKQRSFFYFMLVFFIATLFVQHRDISRYSLPMWPLAAIAFEKLFTSKKFLLILIILLPGIFLFAWNFMLYNILPVSDWSAYL